MIHLAAVEIRITVIYLFKQMLFYPIVLKKKIQIYSINAFEKHIINLIVRKHKYNKMSFRWTSFLIFNLLDEALENYFLLWQIFIEFCFPYCTFGYCFWKIFVLLSFHLSNVTQFSFSPKQCLFKMAETLKKAPKTFYLQHMRSWFFC